MGSNIRKIATNWRSSSAEYHGALRGVGVIATYRMLSFGAIMLAFQVESGVEIFARPPVKDTLDRRIEPFQLPPVSQNRSIAGNVQRILLMARHVKSAGLTQPKVEF